mmetsp:Transcript_59851/g.129710  ORF Transcript_59851/g.129710 Transcript_59851/m.129710 type:complete len:291 (-) Transcript_59851:1630-2502(-)
MEADAMAVLTPMGPVSDVVPPCGSGQNCSWDDAVSTRTVVTGKVSRDDSDVFLLPILWYARSACSFALADLRLLGVVEGYEECSSISLSSFSLHGPSCPISTVYASSGSLTWRWNHSDAELPPLPRLLPDPEPERAPEAEAAAASARLLRRLLDSREEGVLIIPCALRIMPPSPPLFRRGVEGYLLQELISRDFCGGCPDFMAPSCCEKEPASSWCPCCVCCKCCTSSGRLTGVPTSRRSCSRSRRRSGPLTTARVLSSSLKILDRLFRSEASIEPLGEVGDDQGISCSS